MYEKRTAIIPILFIFAMMLLEEKILNELKRGELSPLYSELYRPLLIYASKCLTDELSFLAEDCAQEAIYKAYLSREKFGSFMSLLSFLYKSVHNKAIDILRRDNSKSRYLIEQKDLSEEILPAILEQEALRRLYNAVDRLSPQDRELFFNYHDGMKTEEIAKMLGLSVSAIKQRKNKMVKTLKEEVADDALLIMFVTVLFSDIVC